MTRFARMMLAVATPLAMAGCTSWTDDEVWRLYLLPRQQEFLARNGGSPATAATQPIAPDAPPAITADSTMADYLMWAQIHSPALRAAFERWRAAVHRIPQASALPDPQLSYRYWLERMMAGADGEVVQGVTLTQAIPAPGKLRHRAAVAAAEADAEFQRLEAVRLKLLFDVKQAYIEYAYLRQAVEQARQGVALLEPVEAVAISGYRAGGRTQTEVLAVQSALSKLKTELASLEDMRSPAAARLNVLLNRPPGAELPWPPAAAAPAALPSEERLIAALRSTNPDLLAAAAQVERERQAILLARQENWPDVMLGVEWTDMKSNRKPSVLDPLLPEGEPVRDAWALMVTVNLPVWQDRIQAGIREAMARRLAAEAQRNATANALAGDVSMACFRYRDALRRARLNHDDLLPKAESSLRTLQAGYVAGNAAFGDYLDAQRTLLDVGLAHQRALADAAIRLAELEMIVGKDFSSLPPATQPATLPATQPATQSATAPATEPATQ